MAERGAPLAGEMSGHIFYADGFYGHDDALYVAIRLLGILASGAVTLADWRDRMAPMVNTPEIRFECPEERKFAVIDRIKARLEPEGARVNGIDGVRVSTADGWWLLRASNTQAVLVARAEAGDAAGARPPQAADPWPSRGRRASRRPSFRPRPTSGSLKLLDRSATREQPFRFFGRKGARRTGSRHQRWKLSCSVAHPAFG